MKQVEEAIAENAKGILASTMKEEINQLVKESLSEQDLEDDEIDLDMDVEDDMDSDEEDIDLDTDIDDEDEDEMDMDFDMDMDSDESPIDLTGASDEEILKVFKAMGEKDGIIVQKDGNDIHLTDNENDSEYLVKLGESEEEEEMLDEEDDMEFDFEELGEMDDQTTDDVLDAIFAGGSTNDIDSDQDDEEIMFEIEFEDDDEDFIEEHFFDLHYQALPGAKPINLGKGNLWRLSTDHPQLQVPPCIHRAPREKSGQKRLLIIC